MKISAAALILFMSIALSPLQAKAERSAGLLEALTECETEDTIRVASRFGRTISKELLREYPPEYLVQEIGWGKVYTIFDNTGFSDTEFLKAVEEAARTATPEERRVWRMRFLQLATGILSLSITSTADDHESTLAFARVERLIVAGGLTGLFGVTSAIEALDIARADRAAGISRRRAIGRALGLFAAATGTGSLAVGGMEASDHWNHASYRKGFAYALHVLAGALEEWRVLGVPYDTQSKRTLELVRMALRTCVTDMGDQYPAIVEAIRDAAAEYVALAANYSADQIDPYGPQTELEEPNIRRIVAHLEAKIPVPFSVERSARTRLTKAELGSCRISLTQAGENGHTPQIPYRD